MLRSFKGIRPRLGERVYVDRSAQVIGDVELGDHASIWMNAVVRGDVNWIKIGSYTNIQDNCVIHVQHETDPADISHHVTVGHSVTLHGCSVGPYCLVGMGAIVLNGARIGEECLIGAGSLVTERTEIPPGSLVMGAPARVRRPLTPEERERLHESAELYYGYKETYMAEGEA